jgi:nucleoporin NUP82
MDFDGDDWSSLLKGHPIFSSSSDTNPSQHPELYDDCPSPSGRRQVMVLKDADLILAIGKELRVTSLGDAKLGKGKSKSYKVRVILGVVLSSNSNLLLQVLHTPNIQFDITHLCLNPTRKLLAVAGISQVAVVVLPRPGFMRLVPTVIDCRCASFPVPRDSLSLNLL